MKALKSPLASRLLADPAAREQLREFLTGGYSGHHVSQQSVAEVFRIRPASGEVVRATIVPKAGTE